MMTISRPWAVLGVVFLCLCAAPRSRADLASATQELADKGMEAVRQNQWDMGVNYFKEALAQAPTEPALLFNLALAYDKGAKTLPANLYYRAYLALEPDSQNAARVRKRIAELDVKIEADARMLLRKGRELVDSLPRKTAGDKFGGAGLTVYDALSAYDGIAKGLTRLGDYAAAADNVDATVPLDPDGLSMRYGVLAKALVMAGKDAEARAVISTAADLEVKNHFGTRAPVTDGFDEAGAYRRISIAGMLEQLAEGKLARGDIQGALKLLAEAEEQKGMPADWRYAEVASRQVELGDTAGALATLGLVKWPGRRYAEVLYRISRRQAADGDVQAALDTIQKARTVAAGVTDRLDQPGLNKELAISYASAGKLAEAIKARDAIPEKDAGRDAADSAIATVLARTGAVTEARARAQGIYGSDAQSKAYRDIAYEQAKAGDPQGAQATVDLIGDSEIRLEALSLVAQARGLTRHAHSLALQALAHGIDFSLFQANTEKGIRLKPEEASAVARNFIDRASFSILALEGMRRVDARWKP